MTDTERALPILLRAVEALDAVAALEKTLPRELQNYVVERNSMDTAHYMQNQIDRLRGIEPEGTEAYLRRIAGRYKG